MIIIVRLALNLGSSCNFQVSIGFMDNIIEEVTGSEYKYGFVTNVETDTIGKGLNEEVIRIISAKKEEPDWMLEFRLKAYRHWLTMKMPRWAQLDIPEINYQDIVYYAAPKQKETKSWEEVDPELKATFDKLGIPLSEQMALSGVAVDAVMDSVSVKTTFKDTLAERGVIFCSFSEAVKNHPDLVRKYLGTVVPYHDNYFAALNSAVFSDGSFVYPPWIISVRWTEIWARILAVWERLHRIRTIRRKLPGNVWKQFSCRRFMPCRRRADRFRAVCILA